MNAKKLYYLLGLCLCISFTIRAQSTTDFYRKPYRQGNGFGFRAGFNYSNPTVSSYAANSTSIISILWGVRPKTGFYVSSTYYTDLTINRLSLRFDATFQQKRTGTIDPLSTYTETMSYYYLGIAPMLGLQLTKGLVVYTGAGANLLVATKNAWGGGNPFDIGTTLRCTYKVGPFRAEVGYYRGFTKYDHLDLNLIGGPSKHDFYNQTWEAGLIYNWK